MAIQADTTLGSLPFTFDAKCGKWCAPLVTVEVDGTEWTVDATISPSLTVNVYAYDADGNIRSGTFDTITSLHGAVGSLRGQQRRARAAIA